MGYLFNHRLVLLDLILNFIRYIVGRLGHEGNSFVTE